MRLTLRTLLAYLDDILDPRDAEELAAKIRESDFAGGLIHRIRNSVGRLRLSSPQVLGKGLGADANTVAEYLDNTLPSERVPDFEKVCLESDMMLSEVAACHEILTIVLGEHASVEPSLRRRVYELASQAPSATAPSNGRQEEADRPYRRIDAAVASLDPTAPPAAPAVVPPAAPVTAGVGRWFIMLAGIAATVAMAIWLNKAPVPPPTAQVPDSPQRPDPLPSVVAGGGEVADTTALPDAEPAAPAAEPIAPGAVSAPPEPEPSIDTQPANPHPLSGRSNAAPDVPSLTPDAAPDPAPDAVPDAAPEASPGAEHVAALPAVAADDLVHKPPVQPDDSSVAADVLDEASRATPAVISDVPDTPPPPAAGIAELPTGAIRVQPDHAVVSAWHPDDKTWWRIEDGNSVPLDTSLLILPEFTPKIVTDQGLDITVQGPAEWKTSADHRWTIRRGQFTIANAREQESPLAVTIGSHRVELRCTAPSTVAFLDVQTQTPLGVDPATAPRTLTAKVWVVSGMLRVTDSDGRLVDVAAGERWGVAGDRAAEVIPDTPPDRISLSSVRDIDRQARELLAPQLAVDEPLTAALRAAFQDRRTDVRSLAARGLASLDIFEPLVQTFNDPRFHASWPAHFDSLRDAIQRSPAAAAELKTSVQTHAGPNAEMIYRMLWGFSSQQLEEGAAAKLVEALEHRDLPVRVIAGETLRSITQASAGFRADYHASRRRDAIRIWRRKLQDGAIRYPIAPENDGP